MGPLEAAFLVLLVLWVVSLVITAMKERWLLCALGVLIFPLAYLGALLPARPDSYWFRRKQASAGASS